MRILLTLAALLAPALAQAACPTAASLDGNGIWARYDDGSITHFQRSPDGHVLETTVFDDRSGYWLVAVGGVFMTVDGTVEHGQRVESPVNTYTFPVNPADIAKPRRNASWSGTVEVQDGATGGSHTETLNYRAKSKLNRAVGGCEYYAVRFRYELIQTGDGAVSELDYIPSLGISVLTASGSVGQPMDAQYSVLEIFDAPLN